jgi:hypothetical protein
MIGWAGPLLAGLGHAVLMFLAGPPLGVWPLALVAAAPLGWLVARPYSRPWRDALLVAVGVLPLWGIWEWWTFDVTGAGYAPLAVLQSL